MDDTRSMTERLRAVQEEATSDGRHRLKSKFYHVQWHVAPQLWYVKVRIRNHQFGKYFPEGKEEVAAWVADVAAVMIFGMAGASQMTNKQISRYGHSQPLNYD